MKICKICNNELPKGRSKYCSINCLSKGRLLIERSDKYKIRRKKYREKNIDKIMLRDNEYSKKYYQKNKQVRLLKCKQYREKEREKIKIYHNNFYKNNKEKWNGLNEARKDYQKQYREKMDKDEKRLKFREYYERVIKKSPDAMIKKRLRRRVRQAFNTHMKTKKIRKSDEYGIDYELIINNLKPFPSDIQKYDIDHIRCLASFNFINDDGIININEIKKAFEPTNHQWLLSEENLKKSIEDKKLVKKMRMEMKKCNH